MDTDRLSLRPDAAAYASHRAPYFSQLVAPADDMWVAFADMAAPHTLLVGDEIAGSCCVDDDHQLLRFFVTPDSGVHASDLLQLVLTELEVARMVVGTNDPGFLAPALDVAPQGLEVQALLYGLVLEPTGPGLDSLIAATPDDLKRIVDFEMAAIGAPREFLEWYVGAKLERRELLLHEDGTDLICVGELRRDDQQPGVAQLGFIVAESVRGQGIGTRMMTSLVRRSQEAGLRPYCSTETANIGAQRAIERAGMRAPHRLLFLPA